ncbi:MAG: hypothetical protein CMJ49_06985 [Planctomycetaceae bacterium]|nr:hypothetical protein [Planctomycetaceae bacterium]
MILPIKPQVYDLVAHYEPRADFALSAGIRTAVRQLAKRYTRATWMTGAHAGRPTMHTDMKGISVGTRIEISRLALRPKSRVALVADIFRLFIEAAEKGIASGPIERLAVRFPRAAKRAEARKPVREAFEEVFGSTCCFYRVDPHSLLIGRAVIHQPVINHLREDGPYHSDHQPRVEKVQNELNRQPGRYEGYRYFVELLFTPGQHPEVTFCYSGEKPDRLIEVTMRQKTEEHLVFLPSREVEADPDRFVSLSDYDHGARRFGNVAFMQEGLIRWIDREWLPLVYLFMDDNFQPMMDQTYTWGELFKRQQHSDFAPRASRGSSTFLDLCIEQTTDRNLVVRDGKSYRLHPGFLEAQHVTYYQLGQYDKRLSG